jgi:four helix bundle protein
MMGEPARSFKDLTVWQKAHSFVVEIYKLTVNFPKTEIYGLISQIRRAAVSVPANITEGFKKTGKADKIRYYNISQGILEECRYYLLLAKDLEYGDTSKLSEDAEEISKLLTAYISAVEKSNN